MNTTKTILVGAVALAFSCGGSQDPAAENLTAAEHYAEAEREETRAAEAEGRYDPDARERTSSEGLGPVSVGGRSYNPTEHELHTADQHRRHAAAHRARAEELLAFEAQECELLPEQSRAACPLLLDLEAVEDVNGGVRMVFAEGPNLDPVAQHIRCHIAFAAARGDEGMQDCALYVHGARVERQGNVILLTTSQGQHVADLRARVRRQAP
ncbi:MAG: hypothetical protein VYE22_07540 [Myxococcota bacterium]|nr:hypothetical protein [Myxococcota bacterium]